MTKSQKDVRHAHADGMCMYCVTMPPGRIWKFVCSIVLPLLPIQAHKKCVEKLILLYTDILQGKNLCMHVCEYRPRGWSTLRRRTEQT